MKENMIKGVSVVISTAIKLTGAKRKRLAENNAADCE